MRGRIENRLFLPDIGVPCFFGGASKSNIVYFLAGCSAIGQHE